MHASLWLSLLVGCSASSDIAALEARLESLEADRDDLQADLAAATSRLDALEASDPATDIAALQTGLTAAQGDIDALQDDLAGQDERLDALEGAWVTTEETWTVGPSGDYATLEAAWDAALSWRLTPTASLTILLANGTHALDGEIVLNHPDGDRISITGSSQSAVTVTSPGAGFRIDRGHRIGHISGITLDGASESGLYVGEGSRADIADITLTGFSTGLVVFAGEVTAQGTVTVSDNGFGIALYWGAVLYGEDFDGHGTYTAANVSSSQFRAASLDASDCTGSALLVQYGGFAAIGDVDATGTPLGVGVETGAVFFGAEGTYSGLNGIGLSVSNGGYADPGTVTISSKLYGVYASSNGTANLDHVTFTDVTNPVTSVTDAVLLNYP